METTHQPVTTEFLAPLYVAWELTHRCNARCLHCYSASGPDVKGGNELPLPAALDLIDQLAMPAFLSWHSPVASR
jgi:MoaA/NifB/PqqE/SkfB family radical SAM enzyme